jgi:pimeloyl-ACP methyl ester carboxylesterase
LFLPYMIFNREWKTLDDSVRASVFGQYVALQDGITHYELAGPTGGRIVVLIHGFSVPTYLWDGTFEALSAMGFRVLRFDLYGRGYSDRPKVTYDNALYARQLTGLLEALSLDGPVDLVGISMGAGAVASFAEAHPERVRGLVLMDPAPSSPPPLSAKVLSLPIIGDYFFAAFGSLILPSGQISDFHDPAKMPSGYLERYREQMTYRGFTRAMLSSIRHLYDQDYMDMYARIGKMGRPVMLIWGREDTTVPIANSEALLKLMPTAEFRPIAGAGHLPHIEKPAVVNGLLAEFLGR